LVLSIGTKGRVFTGALTSRTFPLDVRALTRLLYSRCSCPQAEGIYFWKLFGSPGFLNPRVLPLPCFLSIVPSFLRSMVSFSQMRGFSSFPQFWLLSCSWEHWVILLQYGYGVWGHFLLLSFLAGFCTACGARDLYARTTLLHSSAFCARIFAMLSRTLSLLDKTRNSRFRFFI